MATLQGKAVKNTYRQVLQIGANNVGVSGTLQPVQDGAGVNTALSLSTAAATVNGDLTVTGDLIITGGGLQIKELIDDTVAALIKNGTGITWTYNDAANTLTGNFTGTTSVVPEGSNLYYTQGRFDSAFAAKSTTNLAEGTNLYFTTARGNANFATNLAASDTDDLAEGATNLYYTNTRARTALSVTAGTGLSYDNTTGIFNLAAIPNASLTNSSITINGQAVSLGGSVTLTTTNIGEGTNLYWTTARGNANFATNLAASTTTNLAEGTNLYYTQARFDTAFSNKSTTNLAEGTNLYYTQARFNSALAAKTTTDLAEGTNLYYTDARARLALSSSATGLSYANNSGVFSLTAGYAIPTTVKLGQYDIAYNRSIVSAAVTGTSTKTLSLTQQDANVITATWTDLGITTINGTANQIAATTVANTTTLAFTNDVTMPNNLVVSGNLTINGTATYVNTQSISAKDPLFEVANDNNTTDAVDIGYYGRYYDSVQERIEFTGLFRDASDAGKFKIFSGLVDEPTNVVNTTGTGYTVATLVANVDGNLAGTANAANILTTARTIAASGDATWSVSFDGSANVTSALTLANTGVTATTYGTSTSVPTIAVDGKGRITSASNTNITFPVTTVNGFAGTVVLTTSDVAEGTNQYFTTARAQAAITGGASSVVTANLTASRALVSDGSGKIAASATTTTTEIGYLAGVTSAIQTQLNGKLNLTGGTLTGGLIGTTGSFSSSGSGNTFTIGHTSGSGIALNITKDGNGEGLYINKASGSGNAATIIGTLNATTLVKSGGTAGQFLMADGSVNTSVLPSGAYLPLAGGTLTGALSGTSATFSGNLNVGTNIAQLLPITTTNFQILTGCFYDGSNIIATATSGTRIISNAGSFTFNNFTGATIGSSVSDTARLTIASNGAATFSSDVSTNTLFKGRVGSSGVAFETTNAVNADFIIETTSGGLTKIGSGGNALAINNNGGNIGFGVTPAAWSTGANYNGYQFKNASLFVRSNSPELYINNNAFYDGTNWKYLVTASAAKLEMVNNEFTFQNVGSGTAGATATFVDRMKISSAGNITTTNSAAGLDSLVINTTANPYTSSTITSLTTQSGNSTSWFFYGIAGGVSKAYLQTDGNWRIASGSTYGNISDAKMKTNIVDATPKLDDILKIKVRNFGTIDNPNEKYIGFIAQEFEEVFPKLVFQNEDIEYTDNGRVTLGTFTKGIKESALIPILVKAIQEQQAQIEELKAMIAAK